MKTITYQAVMYTRDGRTQVTASSAYHTSKIDAIKELIARDSDGTAVMRINRIRAVSNNDQHFIQLCIEAGIELRKTVSRTHKC